ncbi:MAG: hypothetical protein ACT4OO_01355 [Nitrospiraceae bacterium]
MCRSCNETTEFEQSARNGVDQQRCTGIVLFSFFVQVLYMNRQSHALLKRLNHAETGYVTGGVWPEAVRELCRTVRSGIQCRSMANRREQFDVTCRIDCQNRSVLLRCIGLPDPRVVERSRMLLAMRDIHQVDEAEVERWVESPAHAHV